MREPARKALILSQKSEPLAGDGTPVPPLVDILLARIELISGRMFPLCTAQQPVPDYEPDVRKSFLVQARQRGVSALEVLYDYLSEGSGGNLIYFPIFNYNDGSLDVVRRMLEHPRALFALSDSGAHVGTVCDASFTTFMLTHWVRDRAKDRLGLERAVEMLTRRNARYLGLQDRGVIEPGMRADLNLIDLDALACRRPRIAYDLPAGGRRLVQDADGYVATIKSGVVTFEHGHHSGKLPGHLIRGVRRSPR